MICRAGALPETGGAPRGVRANLKADLTKAMAEGRLIVKDVELGADIVMYRHGHLASSHSRDIERRAAPDLANRALDAVLRALGAPPPRKKKV